MDTAIFDLIDRSDNTPKRYSESLFSFMNRSAWAETRIIRAALETWFAEFPGPGRSDLRERFRSGNDFNYQSALFETVLHAAVARMGCPVDVHPSTSKGTRPDFWVHDAEPFFLEAAVVSDESGEERGSNQRMNAVYDALNKLDCPDFFIGLRLRGSPATPPPAAKIRTFLIEKLATVDYNALRTAFESSGDLDCSPRWRYEHDGWKVDFFTRAARADAALIRFAGFVPIQPAS